MANSPPVGIVFNIQRFSVQDGPGIRSTVFLKGCPLRCLWCSNPESHQALIQLGHNDSLCNGCAQCISACPEHCIVVSNHKVEIDREICTNCGRCVEVCPTEALKLFGKEISVEEAFEEVVRDRPYYLTSGGGVTVSGGEPLCQPEFTEAFLSRCRQRGIHTVLDTCGYAPAHLLETALTHTDLVLFDLKHMNSSKHAEGTGVGNELILDSAKRILSLGVSMIARIPIIPSYNDSVENIRATANFLVSLKHVTKVDLLPYHRFGTGKYVMLDMPYHLDGLSSPQHEQVERLRMIVRSYGLDCEVGG